MSVEKLFDEGGALSSTLKSFERREGQVELAIAIETALKNKTLLVAEAGTGIGKTFAYLLPPLLLNKKILVSTATKNLQDQLFFKDIPTVERILGRSLSAAMLKGRHNYLCKSKFQKLLSSDNRSLTISQIVCIEKISNWVDKTTSGDLSEVLNLDTIDSSFLELIANCEGRLGCDCFDTCFLKLAREKASQAELVIANHALLMADIQLKETGYAEILPSCHLIVIDEAHHLAKTAIQAFSESISSNLLSLLANEIKTLANLELTSPEEIVSACNQLIDSNYALLSTLKLLPKLYNNESETKLLIEDIRQHEPVYLAFKNIMQAYGKILSESKKIKGDFDSFDEKFESLNITAQTIKSIFVKPKNTEKTEEDTPEKDNSASVGFLSWSDSNWTATRMPITLGFRLRNIIEQHADSWVLTSATISFNAKYDAFFAELGLPNDIRTIEANSPFPYKTNSRVYLPTNLPTVDSPNYIDALLKHVTPIVTTLKGRTFILFTSHRALNHAADILKSSDFNLCIQGHEPKAKLIDNFIKVKNSVLLGTMSFWEGVDIQGDNLSCVIIDKIPFPSPSDPIIKEQSDYFKKLGYNAFTLCSLPKASTLLKQGSGRLIRSMNDKGLLILGDNRFTTKGYGKQLLDALPIQTHINHAEITAFTSEL